MEAVEYWGAFAEKLRCCTDVMNGDLNLDVFCAMVLEERLLSLGLSQIGSYAFDLYLVSYQIEGSNSTV